MDIWQCYGQTLWASGPKFCIQLAMYQGHPHAKFQFIWQSLGYFFWLKIPKKGPKNAKKWFFSHNCQITSLSITRFGINGLDLNMYLHEKFHWPVISRFFKIQF